jgi:prefoldin subunit 5
MDEVELLMEETARHYEGKMNKLYQTIRNLGNICRKLEQENADLRKRNAQLIREKKKTQHYRNGRKRGSHQNGRNG